MRYLGLTTLLTITILGISLYSLSFTIITRKTDQQADQHALNTYGGIDLVKKNAFLKQQEEKVLYKLPLLAPVTYQQARKNSLKLGLDLQGGMRMVLRVDVVSLLKELAGRNKRQVSFIKALQKTSQANPENVDLFITRFITNYTGISTTPIHKLFTHSDIQSKLSTQPTPQEVVAAIQQCYKEATRNNVKIYQNRVGNTSSVNFTVNPRQQVIAIEAPGYGQTDQRRLKSMLETPGQFAIYKVKGLSEKQQKRFTRQLDQTIAKTNITSAPSIQKLLLTGVEGMMLCKKENGALVGKYLQSERVDLILPYGLTPIMSSKTYKMQDDQDYYLIYFADTTNPILQGAEIKYAEMGFHQGNYLVQLTTNRVGAKKLRKYTANNIGAQIMIAFDNKAYTVPVIQSEIPNGQCHITGHMSEEEAIDLANICTSGAVAPTETIEETIIGPTLSKQAQDQGMLAVILALILIILFMTMYYGVAGILSSLGLIINAIIILGTLAQLKAALTLPGIAGFIISLGTGIDGSVIINEAVIDHQKQGQSLNQAIISGYNKSYSSIIDANITTLLASIILYICGQGAIKGFAIILTIGTTSSCFTSVLVTRVLKELFIRVAGINKLSFSLFKRSY